MNVAVQWSVPLLLIREAVDFNLQSKSIYSYTGIYSAVFLSSSRIILEEHIKTSEISVENST
jgi:hypothetical protein